MPWFGTAVIRWPDATGFRPWRRSRYRTLVLLDELIDALSLLRNIHLITQQYRSG